VRSPVEADNDRRSKTVEALRQDFREAQAGL